MPTNKKNTILRQLTLLGAALTLLLGFEIAQASTYKVTSTHDAVVGCTGTAPNYKCPTLRDAITAANVDSSPPSTINFSASISGGTITLGSILPFVTAGRLLINGTAQNITISGQGLYEIMNIDYQAAVTLNALTIANGNCVTVSPNCPYAEGGAIFMYGTGNPGSLTIKNSTFYGNQAQSGGAIFTYSPLTITNSTFYGNSAGVGGAITQDEYALNVINSTFSGNTATGSPGRGGAILNYGGTAVLHNTILAGGGADGNCNDLGFGNRISDGDGNLSDDASCRFTQATSQNSVTNLNLGPLASNSGATETVALLSGSAAISSGVAARCPAKDQRGVSRPAGPCSSGAFQYGTVQLTGGSGTGTGCLTTCNITGGEAQTITGTPAALAAVAALGSAGTITENVCIVTADPRQICGGVNPIAPYYSSTTLPVAAVCPNTQFDPGFGSTVIPDYFCGNYGAEGPGAGTGFAVVQGIANGVNEIPGLLQLNDANPDAFFGFTPTLSSPPECSPINIPVDNISVGWAPWSLSPVEGSIPEGDRMIELTDGCGGEKQ